METAIRWSPSSTAAQQRFLIADVVGRTFRHCKVVDYDGQTLHWEILTRHNKVPVFRAFDWSPFNEALVAVGQWSGETTILNLDDGTQVLSLPIKSQRQCNAVAFNGTGLLATGLERVRNDFCLNVFDVNQRIPNRSSDNAIISSTQSTDPIRKLASSEGITSIKFFGTQPETLAAGVKGTCVRIYDLRESGGVPALQHQTPCVHNIAIDSTDENYFASAGPAKDATIHIWDRRSTPRLTATNLGSSGSHAQGAPVLVLRNVFDAGRNAEQASLWSLRYCKSQSGCLGILTSTGEYKIIETKKDYLPSEDIFAAQQSVTAENIEQGLYVSRAYDIENPYYHRQHGREENERIVSFDFINLRGPHSGPCAITLRNDRNVEISERRMQKPILASSARSALLVRSMDDKIDTTSNNECYVVSNVLAHRLNVDSPALSDHPKHLQPDLFAPIKVNKYFGDCLQASALPRIRCSEGYLFDCVKNTSITEHQTSLQELWRWIGRARANAEDGGMISEQFDLSYLGVYSLWNNYLGRSKDTRTIRQAENRSTISQAIERLYQRLQLSKCEILQISRSEHRKVCLNSYGLCMSSEDLEITAKDLVYHNKNTEAAFLAMIYRNTKLAFQSLRNGNSSEALRTLSVVVGAFSTDKTDDTWLEMIQDISGSVVDVYSRAILALVSNGDWHDVLKVSSIPLRYRTAVALIHLDDEGVSSFIHEQSTMAIKGGFLEGIVLTGLHDNAMDMFETYISKSADLQSAVLAMSFSAPRFVQDRRFGIWKEEYRSMMNSWKMFVARSRFDMQSTVLATSPGSSNQMSPVARQITLRCGNCDRALDRNLRDEDQQPSTNNTSTSHEGSIFADARSGTVCPRCGSHLPRCVICDMWVGVPNPHTRGGAAAAAKQRNLLISFIMVCQTCQHVSHGHHAQEWFSKHAVCPSPDCNCPCVSLDNAGVLC